MIAHRLTTIASADNLLYFKSRSQLVSAEKGSPEYEEIFEKLKCIQYAYGDDEKDDGQDGDEGDEHEVIEEEESSAAEEAKQGDTKPGLVNTQSPTSAQPADSQDDLPLGDHHRKGSINSMTKLEEEDETSFSRKQGNKRINPSGPIEPTDFNVSGRERLLSESLVG